MPNSTFVDALVSGNDHECIDHIIFVKKNILSIYDTKILLLILRIKIS